MQQRTRNEALKQLDALVGEWELHASYHGQSLGGGGRTTFAWMEGGAFLIQHADAESSPDTPAELVENSPFPVVTIIGLDDSTARFTMLYADARGVDRVYEMSLSDGVWRVWRNAPGFNQRFTGTFSDDGRTISGQWEMSPDGSNWEPDLEISYTNIS